MSITLPGKKSAIEDYKNLPEGALYQLINGELIMAPALKKSHQEILRDILVEIANFLKNNSRGDVYPSPFDIHLDEENVFQPDICFISKDNRKNFGEDDYYHGAPDLVIEILSPSNAMDDFVKKFRGYEKFGVKEYFMVDPDSKEVIGYYLSDGRYSEIYRETGVINSKILDHLFQF